MLQRKEKPFLNRAESQLKRKKTPRGVCLWWLSSCISQSWAWSLTALPAKRCPGWLITSICPFCWARGGELAIWLKAFRGRDWQIARGFSPFCWPPSFWLACSWQLAFWWGRTSPSRGRRWISYKRPVLSSFRCWLAVWAPGECWLFCMIGLRVISGVCLGRLSSWYWRFWRHTLLTRPITSIMTMLLSFWFMLMVPPAPNKFWARLKRSLSGRLVAKTSRWLI